METARNSKPSRRTIAKSAVWAVPAAVAATAAPAYAASNDPNYRMVSSWFTEFKTGTSCTTTGGNPGGYLTDMEFKNAYTVKLDDGTYSPFGFNVLNQTQSNGQTSPSVGVTLDHYTITLYYLAGMVVTTENGTANGYVWKNGFGYDVNASTALWGYPSVRKNVTLTNPNTNRTAAYDAFTFTWNGDMTSTTADPSTTDASPSWEGSATLAGLFDWNPGFCAGASPWYAVGIDSTFTTTNEFAGSSTGIFWTQMNPSTGN